LSTGKPARLQADSDRTLRAVKEFAVYLNIVEKDISNRVKQLRNKETSQSAGFVATGIHEAKQYLEIVRKVIEKTQKAQKTS